MTTELGGWVGQVLAGGRYRVTARLGSGGMAHVYRAADLKLGCDVVVKVPRRSLLDDPDFAARFAREIRSLARLNHPHVVKATDVGGHAGLPFAVLQYLPGGSLRDRQKRAGGKERVPLTVAQVGAWLEETAAALDYIHGQGYVHRDVKPENILFDAHGHAYL